MKKIIVLSILLIFSFSLFAAEGDILGG